MSYVSWSFPLLVLKRFFRIYSYSLFAKKTLLHGCLSPVRSECKAFLKNRLFSIYYCYIGSSVYMEKLFLVNY
jgi:hypothetical protein